jgi:hypothetical protein
MLSHIASDLHQAYLEEVFKPQLGKPGASTPTKPTSPADLDGDGNVDSFEKKVRQFIYDVRHLMRKQNIPVERAFQMRSSKTNYGAEVIKTAKEKLGIKGGGAAPVSEEVGKEKLYSIVINYKNGTTYRKRTSRSEINRLRSNPNVSSVEMTKYGVDGLAKKDYDGDGKIESGSKEHAGAVHNAIQRATGGTPDGKDTRRKTSKKKLKSYGVSEGFSNWRQDLKEVLGVNDEMASRDENQIKEKNVNNYAGGKDSVVKINPEVTEKVEILGGYIVESVELNEDYLSEAVDIATEFFYNCGLNENGVDIVIEELGEETFSEFVFELSEEYLLSEELKKSESKVKTSKAPKGTKQYATTIARVKKQGGTTMSAKDRVASTIRKDRVKDRVKKAVDKAKETQAPSSEKSPEGQKKGIFGRAGSVLGAFVKKGKEDIAKVQDAAQTARKVGERRAAEVAAVYSALREKGKKAEQSATATRARRRATVAAGRAVNKAAGAAGAAVGSGVAARKRGASAAGVTGAALGAGLRKLTMEELELQEKAESEQQQKLFGLALSVKRGETPRSEVSAEVLKIVDSMSEKKIRDFAKTPHSEVPKKKVTEAIANPKGGKESPKVTQRQKDAVEIQTDNARARLGEDMAPTDPRQISAQKKVIDAQNLLGKANRDALKRKSRESQQNQNQELQTQNASYEPEGESIDERTAFAQRTGKHFRTGRPSVEGGDPRVAEINKPPVKIGGSRQEPKVPGKKPPVAGEPGSGRQDPAHIVSLRRAARERAKQQRVGSRFD